MKKLIYIFIMALLIAGCATAAKMNRLSVGMSKDEVIKVMGNPNSQKASEGVECLEYYLSNSMMGDTGTYWVMMKDGKVIQYGRAGDFGTALPQDRREYNIKIQNK
ncbi:hypothetical protein HZB96_05065 [Candidatus Gottesmanbacteria bacterium]|nr:hypothetical protein [Candidatus Gottesmanbacteria bacterium]